MPVTKNTAIMVSVVVVVAFIACMYFIGLPLMKGNPPSGATAKVTPSPVITTAMPTTMFPTTVPQTLAQKRADQYETNYTEVYTSNRTYNFGAKEVFNYDLTTPPLYILFNIIPGMVVREKLADIGLPTEHNVTAIYVNPNAWFEVKVLDSGTGSVVDKRGFNKDYSQMAKQEFMVRTKGDYRVEMAGNDVSVNVQILTGN